MMPSTAFAKSYPGLLIVVASIFIAAFTGCHRPATGDLRIGEHREGILRQSDAIRQELPHGPENRWTFLGQAGQAISLTAESYEFDTYLLLFDPQNHLIGSGDDNGILFNAQIATVLPANGRYTAVVCGANADQFGTYWLTLGAGSEDADWSQAAVESYYQRGIEWGRRVMSARALSWMSLEMARYCRQRRQWDSAEHYCADGLAHAEAGDFAYGRWAAALEHGRLLKRRRSYDQAVNEFQRALQLSKSLQAGSEADTLAQIEFGNLYYSTARANLATVYFRKATEQAQQYALPSTQVELYTSLNDFPQLQDSNTAIDYAEKSYALREGLDPVLELKATQALAGTYLFLQPERSQEGLALAHAMRDRATQLGCLDEEVAALTLMSMAKYATNQVEEMIQLAGEALALTSPVDKNLNAKRIALQLLADGEMARGNHEAALQWCSKALQDVESAWASEYIEEMRTDLLSQSRAICTQIIRNLFALNAQHPSMEYARQAFDYAERSRSRSLLEHLLTVDKRIQVAVDPQILGRDQEILDKLSAVRGQLALLPASTQASRDTLHRLQEQRANLIAERLQLQTEIRQSTQNLYHATQMSPLTAEQVQKKLIEHYPNSVILYYQLGIQESFLIVVARDGFYFFKLPDWKIITQAVTDWRNLITGQLNGASPTALYDYDQAAHRLYTLLIEPAASLIRQHDLIIVPSEALSQVAFEALAVADPNAAMMPGRDKYLIEQHAISYAPSASVLSEIESRRRRPSPIKRMLLLGDAFVGDSTQTFRGDSQSQATALGRLPGARQEILEIAGMARQQAIVPTIWLGPMANEAQFKSRDLSPFQWIHIATHGLSNSQDGGASALTLALDQKGNEDGILTSDEIARLKLKADLVVLSGCETSTGQKDGAEGIVGLNRAFLISGVRCVCGSLWPVEDDWTQRLMTAFYKNMIFEGKDQSQALRLAKLNLLKHGALPAQWAPFILTGSSRSIR